MDDDFDSPPRRRIPSWHSMHSLSPDPELEEEIQEPEALTFTEFKYYEQIRFPFSSPS